MEQRLTLVTLGVADVAVATRFYEALGWSGQVVQETAFFQAGGIGVVLWDRVELARDAGREPGTDEGHGGITLAHNVRSRDQVDTVLARAAAAGATVTRSARETFYGGWAGSFVDPDGHTWEIAHNPGLPLAADGTVTIPDFTEADDPA